MSSSRIYHGGGKNKTGFAAQAFGGYKVKNCRVYCYNSKDQIL
jgi:hypothetical protein